MSQCVPLKNDNDIQSNNINTYNIIKSDFTIKYLDGEVASWALHVG